MASGIITDDNNKDLFSELIENQRLIRAWDFENREGIFPEVHRSYRFCLLCAGGVGIQQQEADFAFYLTKMEQLAEPERHFTLSAQDLNLLNPNTKTCPTFRNKHEANITKEIYRKVPAWALHQKYQDWPGIPKTPFNMSNDSGLFSGKDDLLKNGWSLNERGHFRKYQSLLLPLYESKLIHQFNHRYATFAGQDDDDIKQGNAIEIPSHDLADPSLSIECRYWLDSHLQSDRFPGRWFLVFRDVTNGTNERASIAAIIPAYPCSNSLSIVQNISVLNAMLLCANLNTFVYDYVTRQKIPGVHLNHWIWK